MPSPSYNDGTVKYGSQVIAVTTDGSTSWGSYVADNISVNRPAKVIERTNQIGEPSGSVGIKQFETGSATFQCAVPTTTKEPLLGHQFTATLDSATSGIGAETFFITGVSEAFVKDAEFKWNVTFIKKYN